jgi:uncharacterized protein (TIGR00369 family)
MKNELYQLLDQCIENASEEDLSLINALLKGVRYNQTTEHQRGGNIAGLLQIETKFEGEVCIAELPINPVNKNPLGIVHGGITATLIDHTMGALSFKVIPEGHSIVTTGLNIHYISPGIGDSLLCEATIEHKGSQTIVLSATVYRTDGKKVAKSTGSFFIIKRN